MTISSNSSYRPDIDGLRAIAVIAVIINHLNKELLPGGFLGVDIFFVISGFVVTSSLANRQDQIWQDYFVGFYANRVKRIMPALIACVVLTSILGCIFIHPSWNLQTSLRTGISSLYGGSNFYLFKQNANYFSNFSMFNLFLQTWSLGVEEQFYLIYPIVIILCGFNKKLSVKGNKNLFLTMISLSSLSFCVKLYLDYHDKSDIAFFMMPARFWELGIGSMIFSIQKSKCLEKLKFLGDKTRSFLSIIAIIITILSLFVSKPFQELPFTILIALSTGGIILLQRISNPITYFLSLKYLVLIGKLSYSLYLWHWSVIVISRFTIGITKETILLQLSLIIVLSLASYNYIERPFRYNNWNLSRLKTIGIGLLASLISIFLLFALDNTKGKLFAGAIINSPEITTFNNERKNNLGEVIWSVDKCVLSENNQVGKNISFDNCTFGNLTTADRKVLVVGNSFSAAEIDMYLPLIEQSSTSVTVTSCWGATPVATLKFTRGSFDQACSYYFKKVIPDMISKLDQDDILLMVNSIEVFSPKTISSIKDAEILVNGLPSNHQERQNEIILFLRNLSSSLKAKGVKVIFQSTTPFMFESECTPESSLPQWFYYRGKSMCKFLTRTETIARKNAMDSMLMQLESETDNFFVLDIFDDICQETVCKYLSSNGHFIYRDLIHLSDWGSKQAAPKLLQTVNRAVSNTDKNRATVQ